jgi:type IV pilus assembly protein PilE
MERSVSSGFSLLELLIALAIVAILASITTPSYTGFVAKTRRSDAISSLLSVQLAQERWRSSHPAYGTDLVALGIAETSQHYRLFIERADVSDYLAVAQPRGSQRADLCGAFAVCSDGPIYERGFAGPDCWRR